MGKRSFLGCFSVIDLYHWIGTSSGRRGLYCQDDLFPWVVQSGIRDWL